MLANMFVTTLAALLPLVSGQHYLNLVSHNIYTISTQYLHYIYTISTQYLHNIYTISTLYLHYIYTIST